MKIKYSKICLYLLCLSSLFSCGANYSNYKSNEITFASLPNDYGKKDNELLPFENLKTQLFGYKNKKKQIVIEPIFKAALAFNEHGIADVLFRKKNTWFKINKLGTLLTESYFFDNGPDYYVNGMSRFKENSKLGYINSYGKIVIPAAYDWASPFFFSLPIAIVCIECIETMQNPKFYPEIKGGKWGAINIQGEVIIPIKYDGYTCHNKLVVLKKANSFYKLLHNKHKGYFLQKMSKAKSGE